MLLNYTVIVINPQEAERIDYELNWKDLVTFEDYLSIKAQRTVYESNAVGYAISNKENR